MKILIWGLGYVGTVSAACFAELGHDVVGVEPNIAKVKALNECRSSIIEQELPELLHDMVNKGRLRAVQDGIELIKSFDLSIVCVGTPSAANGGTLLDHVRQVSLDIGRGLRDAYHYHVVIVRSTMFPGMTRNVVRTILEEESGKKAGEDFGLVFNPEFLREADAVNDFRFPPYTVIGEYDQKAGELAESLYKEINAPVYRVNLEEAELLKLICNAYHALKVGFANEIGRICKNLNIDSHVVMDLFCRDTKLNISPAYLRPGYAFGGSCLPKDLRSITHYARSLGVNIPILESVLHSNKLQIEAAHTLLQETKSRSVAVLGLSFKPGTDDIRESPVVALIQDLWKEGMDVRVFDPDIQLSAMLGSNREYLERQLPQINSILKQSLEDVLDGAQAIIVTQKRPEFIAVLERNNGNAALIDLVRLTDNSRTSHSMNYKGLSW